MMNFKAKRYFQLRLKDFPREIVEKSSEITHESGQTFDSQETISDGGIYSEFNVNETPKNIACQELLRPSASFPGNLDPVNTKSYLESCESDIFPQILMSSAVL